MYNRSVTNTCDNWRDMQPNEGKNMAIVVHLDVELAKRKVSSKELARRLGVTEQTVSRYKCGRGLAIKFEFLDACCRELGCQPGDLLEYVPD